QCTRDSTTTAAQSTTDGTSRHMSTRYQVRLHTRSAKPSSGSRLSLAPPTPPPPASPGDVGPLGGGKLDLREVGLGDLVQQPRVATALRVRGEESVHVGDEDRAIGAEGARELEHQQIPGADGEPSPHIPHDVPD